MRSSGSLLITRNLPPLRGGMERLNLQICRELVQLGPVHVVGPRGCAKFLPEGVTADEVPVKSLPIFLLRAFFVALAASVKRKPAWVIAGSGLSAPIAWFAGLLVGARRAVYVHGLDLVVSSFVYRWLWLPFIRRCELCIANSRHTAGLARQAGVNPEHIVIVNPGVEAPRLPRNAGHSSSFRDRHELGNGPLLLSVGRLTQRKGMLEFVTHAMPEILACAPNARLVVIGDDAPDALSGTGKGLWSRVLHNAGKLGIESSLVHVGVIDDDDLAAAYSAAAVHVFPVRSIPGDVEGFGMVALEAAAWGTPTVAFAVGGVPDAVKDGESGFLVAPDDYVAFAKATCDLLVNPWARQSPALFAESHSWARFGDQLREALGKVGSR